MNDQGFRSTVGCYLAWALLRLGRLDEAERVAIEAAQLAAEDDYAVQADSRQVRALVHARRGEFEEAERLARRAIALTEPTDSWSERGTTNVTLAEVLDGAGRRDEARDALEDAVALFRRKADRAASADARGRFPHLVGGD
jgi:Flp pilus assembly protein TadD